LVKHGSQYSALNNSHVFGGGGGTTFFFTDTPLVEIQCIFNRKR